LIYNSYNNIILYELMRYTSETLIDYCKENNITLLNAYENIKINRESLYWFLLYKQIV
jgi:hypothetical protein